MSVTLADTTGLLCGSVIVPRMVEVPVCEQARETPRTKLNRIAAILLRRMEAQRHGQLLSTALINSPLMKLRPVEELGFLNAVPRDPVSDTQPTDWYALKA